MNPKRKPTVYVAAGAVIGAIVSLVLSHVLCLAQRMALRNEFDSEVKPAVRSMLDDVHTTLRDGKHKLAMVKIALWEKRWEEYRRGGHTPEEFAIEVTSIYSAEHEQRAP